MACYIFMIILLFITYGFCKQSANSVRNPRSIGGRSTTIQQFPYTVSIRIGKYSDEYLCGGFIVSRKNVITACHCMIELSPREYQVRIGSNHYDRGGQLFNVKQFLCHPDAHYRHEMICVNDIAVLELTEPIAYGTNVSKVDFYGRIIEDYEDLPQTAIFTGWGAYNFGHTYAPVLQVVELPVVSVDQCKHDYLDMILNERLYYDPNYDVAYEGQMCAGVKTPNPTRNLCAADSGGHLVIVENDTVYAIGVASYSSPCSEPSYPSVFTQVSYYLAWLDQHITFDSNCI